MDRKDLQVLSRIRLGEARALARLGLNTGAYYLAGYSVECALKSCIARSTRRYEFPGKKKADVSHTHNLRELMKVAGLEDMRLEEAKKDATFRNNWDLVQSWSEQSRYRVVRADTARALVAAVGDRSHVVLQWIKRHW